MISDACLLLRAFSVLSVFAVFPGLFLYQRRIVNDLGLYMVEKLLVLFVYFKIRLRHDNHLIRVDEFQRVFSCCPLRYSQVYEVLLPRLD